MSDRPPWEGAPNARRLHRIVNACHAEASEIRYEAEEAARARRRAAEADARRHVEEARRSSEELVLGRLRRLSELSAEIEEQYRRVVAGLDAAQAVGGEVQLLVGTLDRAARQLGREEPLRLAADPPVDGVE